MLSSVGEVMLHAVDDAKDVTFFDVMALSLKNTDWGLGYKIQK